MPTYLTGERLTVKQASAPTYVIHGGRLSHMPTGLFVPITDKSHATLRKAQAELKRIIAEHAA